MLLFHRFENFIIAVIPVEPQPSDDLSAYGIIEELHEIPFFLKALPALQQLQTELENASGESLPPALQS